MLFFSLRYKAPLAFPHMFSLCFPPHIFSLLPLSFLTLSLFRRASALKG
jgi:hypothetical protein